MGWQQNCVRLNFDSLSTCANKMRVRFTILFHPKTMTSTTFNTFQECECLLGLPPSFGHNMTAPNFKSFPTIRNTRVRDVTSSWPNSEQGAQIDCFLSVLLTQSQSLSAWHKAHSFYQCRQSRCWVCESWQSLELARRHVNNFTS